MQPFATFSIKSDRVNLSANRGAEYGVWLVRAAVLTAEGNSWPLEIKTSRKQPCFFHELRDQLINDEINELFDDIEKKRGERPVDANFVVYKLRSAKRG